MKAKRIVEYVTRIIEESNWVAFATSAVLLFSLVFIVSIEVIFRYFLRWSLGWTFEVVEYILVGTTFLTIGYIQSTDHHLKVTLLISKLGEKKQEWLRITVMIISLIYCSAIFWGSVGIAWKSFLFDLRSESEYGLPLGPYQSLVPIGCVLFCLQCLVNIRKSIRCFRRNSREETDSMSETGSKLVEENVKDD